MKNLRYSTLITATVLGMGWFVSDPSHAQGCKPGDIEIKRTKTYIRCKPGPEKVACITQKGAELDTGMNKCKAVGTTCLVESDLDDKAAACMAGSFFAVGGTAVQRATAATPPGATVTLVTLAAAATNCALQIRSIEKAMIKCESKMDTCRGEELDRHKKSTAACEK